MKKYSLVLLVFLLSGAVNGWAQEEAKLHGAAKHHRSPDAEVSHKGKKHMAEPEKKTAAKPETLKPVKKAVVAKAEHKPVVKKAAAVKPAEKKTVAVKHSVKKVAAVKPATRHSTVVRHKPEHAILKYVKATNRESIVVSERTPTTDIEIKNGNVLINDSFVFKIKSLKNEDHNITLNYQPPVTRDVDANSVSKQARESDDEDEDDAKPGKALLGVYSLDAPDGGAIIESVVPGSPACDAGLHPGEVIVSVNDRKIDDSKLLATVVGEMHPGDKVTITYLHFGRSETATVELADAGKMGRDGKPYYYKHFSHGGWRW